MDMSLSKLGELAMDQGGLACCSPWGHKELDTKRAMRLRVPRSALRPHPPPPARSWVALRGVLESQVKNPNCVWHGCPCLRCCYTSAD